MSSTTDPRNPQTNDPREAKFPPLSWLGWSLDMTSVTPSDISSVTASVLKASRLLNISKRRESQSFNSGVTWEVPENVDATDDVAEGGSSYYTFEDGTKAASSITGDASLSAKYMAVSGSGSANYSISKMFQASYSYALFSYNENLIQASIEGWADYINEEGLGKRLKNLPKWDPDNDDTVGKYRRFFRTEGTHVITGTSYGGRFQLTAWASNHNSEQKQSFGANVSVEYNGLTNGGRFNASVKGSSEYSEFSKSIQKIVSCKGGDPDLAGTIASSVEKDGIYGDFKAWVDTSRRNPAIMAMQTVSIWDMMSAAIDDRIVHRAAEVESAFKHIVRHPAKHVTKCRFVVNSDWGEIGLLTPAAFIRHDASSPALPEFSIATTKLSWGSEHSSEFRRDVTVDFEIVNDGSPVDIMLSHGSDGATRGNGECAVTIYETRYANSGIKDNDWNSQWFYQCEVNPDEAS